MHKRSDVPLEHVTTRSQGTVRTMSEAELIAGARARKNAHIGQLMQLHAARLRQKLIAFAGETTDDVVADTFLSLPEKLIGYVDEGKFEQWLYGVAFNIARTKRRSNIRREQHFVDTEPDIARLPSALARVQAEQVLEIAEAELSPAEREVWFLSYQGYSPTDIGHLLGLKESAVNVRLHRARARLSKLLGTDG